MDGAVGQSAAPSGVSSKPDQTEPIKKVRTMDRPRKMVSTPKTYRKRPLNLLDRFEDARSGTAIPIDSIAMPNIEPTPNTRMYSNPD